MPLTSCSHISQGSRRRLTFLGHSVDMLISSLTPSLYSALSLTQNVLILSLNQTNLTMDFPYLYQFILPSFSFPKLSANFIIKLLSSVQFSRSVMSNSLQPHESQHARPLCPSPTPGVHSDSRPWSQ